MNALMLLFALISLSLAGYPVDFASHEPRASVDGALPAFWLEAGVHHADISGRTDFNESYLELQFSPEQADVECFYSVWYNGNKIVWGNFNSATSSVIPIIGANTLVNDPEMDNILTVTTANCYLGRFAIPYKMGDNGNALYLYNLHPAVQPDFDHDYSTIVESDAMNYYPGFEFGNGYEGVESWNAALYHSGLCKFSSQACTVEENGFWMPSYGGSLGVKIVWDDALFYDNDAFDGVVVIETSGWFSSLVTNVYRHCNSTASDENCESVYDFGNYNGELTLNYEYGGYTQDDTYLSELDAYVIEDKKRSTQEQLALSPAPDDDNDGGNNLNLNSSRFFYRTHYTYEEDDDEDLEDSLYISFSMYQVVFPYAKVWAIGMADPIHILADLTDFSESEECHNIHGETGVTEEANTGYPTYGGLAALNDESDYIVSYTPFAVPHRFANSPDLESEFGYTPEQFWVYCGQDPAGDDLTWEQITEQYNDLDLEGGESVETEAVEVVDISLPNGGFINPLVFDMGIPLVFTPTTPISYYEGCADEALSEDDCSSWWPYAANQLSSYDFYVNGVVVGHHEQFFLKRFDRQMISGFGVEGFVLDANTSNLNFQLKSSRGLSITASSYIQINAFPAIMCDDSESPCGEHGHCADPYVTDACECDPTHMGDACDELVPFCVADDPNYGCMNGGVCEESADRELVLDVAGQEWVIVGATTCNCEGTAMVDGEEVYSGDFRGAHCEIPAPCNNNPCLNEGTCVNGDYQDYTCDCAGTESPYSGTEYEGAHCETPTNTVCDPNPCENGGDCEVDEAEPGEFKCTCVDGWDGETCTVAPTNGCSQQDDSNTCAPFGHCVSGSNPDSNPPFTHCVCSYGYSGEFCKQAPPACEGVDCQNGGSCIGFKSEGQEAWNCLCQEPFVGQNCQWNNTFEATKVNFPTKE